MATPQSLRSFGRTCVRAERAKRVCGHSPTHHQRQWQWHPARRAAMSSSGAAPNHATAPQLPRYAVAVTVIDQHAATPKVLMVRRGNEPRKGHWFLPGGKVELGETTIAAAARELGEECGIGIDAVALHGRAFTVTDAIIPGPSGTYQPAWHYAIAQCFGIVRSPAVVQNAVAGDDADELGWFTVEEIAALEQVQGAGGSASVAARAIKLNELGLLPPDHSES